MSAPTIDLHPMLAAVDELDAGADVLCSGEVWQLPGDQLATVWERVERIGRLLGYGGLRVLADMHARGVAREQAGLPTKAFLVDRLRISPVEAGGCGL